MVSQADPRKTRPATFEEVKQARTKPPKKAVRRKDIVRAARKDKELKIRCTIFPESGRPWVEDLEPDEEGLVTTERGETFKVKRNSVWEEDGVLRAIVQESGAQTINVMDLEGDSVMHPRVLHGIAHNNLWMQLDEINKQQSPWKQASTWATILLGVGIILMLFWMIKTQGDGFEQLRHAIDNIQINRGGGSAQEAGHQPIAPGGNGGGGSGGGGA